MNGVARALSEDVTDRLDLVRDKKPNQESNNETDLRSLKLQYTGNWVWRSVAALASTGEDNSSPKTLAKRLDVDVEEVVDALEGLEALGILKRVERGYEKTQKVVRYTDEELDPRSLMSDHVLITTQILGRLNPFHSAKSAFYRTGFIASNRQLVTEFCHKVENLMRELIEKSTDAPVDEVYALSLSTLNVSDAKEPKQ